MTGSFCIFGFPPGLVKHLKNDLIEFPPKRNKNAIYGNGLWVMVQRNQLIRIHTVFHSACKILLVTWNPACE